MGIQEGEEIQPGHPLVVPEDPDQAGLLAVTAELVHLGITSITHRIRVHLSRTIRIRLHPGRIILSRTVLSRLPQRRTPLTRAAAHRAEIIKQLRRNIRLDLHIREIPEQDNVPQMNIEAGNHLSHMEHVDLRAV